MRWAYSAAEKGQLARALPATSAATITIAAQEGDPCRTIRCSLTIEGKTVAVPITADQPAGLLRQFSEKSE
ncbi:hypothetical protein [Mesorhizobium sp. 128a]